MARKAGNPQLLSVLFGALLASLVGVVAIAETGSWWVVGLTIAAVILLVLGLVLDVSAAVDGASRFRLVRPRPARPPSAPRPERPGFDFREGPA